MVLSVGDKIYSARSKDTQAANGIQVTGIIVEIITTSFNHVQYKIKWDDQFTHLQLSEKYNKQFIRITDEQAALNAEKTKQLKAANRKQKKAHKHQLSDTLQNTTDTRSLEEYIADLKIHNNREYGETFSLKSNRDAAKYEVRLSNIFKTNAQTLLKNDQYTHNLGCS